jgi:uroporphyrin-III C-methyltransferase
MSTTATHAVTKTGSVYLVGAGPGAPDLLTLRAARLLARADIVFYDALVHTDTLALAHNARHVCVGKRAGEVSTDQRFINRALIEAARQFKTVVRLKGGDPMLFGRAQEELAALHDAGIATEVVPGITAALAASASLQTSLTARGVSRSVSFITPRVGQGESENAWLAAAIQSDTCVLYMAKQDAPQIAAALMAAGKSADTAVAIVENASLTNEQQIRTTLAGLAQSSLALAGPALVMIGEVYRTSFEQRTIHIDQSMKLPYWRGFSSTNA